jgi:hypothetical protein
VFVPENHVEQKEALVLIALVMLGSGVKHDIHKKYTKRQQDSKTTRQQGNKKTRKQLQQ